MFFANSYRTLISHPRFNTLVPRRDLPSTTMAEEGGIQPTDYDSHDESGGFRDSRNPIAPPVTYLEGAMVIYSADTPHDSIGIRETPIELVSVT